MSTYFTSLWLVVVTLSASSSQAFLLPTLRDSHILTPRATTRRSWVFRAQAEDTTGDPLRAATGIRPSLHPTTMNAIAEALKIRSSNDPDTPLVVSDEVQPLDVALSAGKIAATAIEKRQSTSQQDGMTLTPEEGQTIAGRVVGVVMRFTELENLLYEKVSAVGWVQKYNEWTTFGVLEDEVDVMERIRTDPLFALCRAECLLALFLHTVESPQMDKIQQSVPGGSTIDFLDADRQEVLLTYE